MLQILTDGHLQATFEMIHSIMTIQMEKCIKLRENNWTFKRFIFLEVNGVLGNGPHGREKA